MMNKIRVLHFTKIINRNDFIDVIIRHANPSRFLMMACSYNGESNIEGPGYEIDHIPNFKLGINHGWVHLFVGAWRLAAILRSERVQVIHTHHYYEAIIGRMACLLVPSCKHIIGRHYHDQFYLTTTGFKLWYYLKAENWVNRWAHAIVVPSTAIVELLEKQGVSTSKVFLVPYGFNFDAQRYSIMKSNEVATLRREIGWDGKWVIGNIARHHVIKGQTYLLNAFRDIKRQIPNSILVMIGDGPHHANLLEEVKILRIENDVHFLGWRKDAHRLINAMDVVVHPTLQEAFPQLMVEAMALSKPLLITPVSGAADIVQHEKNGLLIPFQDSEAIVDGVNTIFRHPEAAKKIGSGASKWVRENLSLAVIIPRYEQIYERVAAQ